MRRILLFLLFPSLLLNVSCASDAGSRSPSSQAEATRASGDFARWLESYKQRARQAGITEATLNQAFRDIGEPDDSVVRLDRKQPETTITFEQYQAKVVNTERIEKARRLARENAGLLGEVSRAYGVHPSFIVALWGIESNFGEITGNFSVIESLATLAYEGRRAEFFEGELTKALRIVQDNHIQASDMLGSWAGAMGQCQFMPSSFLSYAQDFNRDGRKDIWSTRADVFASIANYLKQSGWDASVGWGKRVTLPAQFDASLAGRDKKRPLSFWRAQGLDVAGLKEGAPYAVIQPDDEEPSTGYLVSSNFDVIMKWNRSAYFATAVGRLSDAIRRDTGD